jgi:23S rRNA pseudouridine1911/1915/1917 synthase
LVGPVERAHHVPAEAKGARLDQHLVEAFPELSRSRIQSLIEEGAIAVNGKQVKPSARLRGGESVRLTLAPPKPARAEAQALPLSILHEDAELVVVDKAAGMVVHPAAGHSGGTLVNALLHRVEGLSGIGGEVRPGIVHRLDKETSGCLVVAKTERALLALQKAFKAREVEKTYLALVHGAPPDEGRIETLYGRHPVHRKRFTSKVREGKPALTEFRVRERFEGAALLEVELHTGRTHQIRVHLSEAGYPLLGDAVYGRSPRSKRTPVGVQDAEKLLGRQGLHAWRLGFAHPKTKRRRSFEAEVPADFARALARLRGEGAEGTPRGS